MTDWTGFLQRQGARLAPDGTVAGFGEDPADYAGLTATTLLLPLDDRGLITLEGPDTDKLLQGQLTCDVAAITADQTGAGALCTVKGRMLGNFSLYRAGDQTRLVTHRALTSTLVDTLKKYAVFYKTQLTDASDAFRVLGLAGPDAGALAGEYGTDVPGGCDQVLLSPHRRLLVVPADQAEALWARLAARATPAGLSLWTLLAIRDGLGEVRPETVEEFIPQMLNLQHTGAVSFRKGCYTGQEIVARMQYLGKLKRRRYRLAIPVAETPAPGADIVISAGGANAGQVVMAARSSPDSSELLAVLTAEAAAADSLIIAGAPTPVRVLPLPYDDKFAPPAQDG